MEYSKKTQTFGYFCRPFCFNLGRILMICQSYGTKMANLNTYIHQCRIWRFFRDYFDSNLGQIIMVCQSWNQNGGFKYLFTIWRYSRRPFYFQITQNFALHWKNGIKMAHICTCTDFVDTLVGRFISKLQKSFDYLGNSESKRWLKYVLREYEYSRYTCRPFCFQTIQ